MGKRDHSEFHQCGRNRIAQQCIKQVLEPICEAKFNKHSHGFRPNRSPETAMADATLRVNRSHMQYVVNVDIQGFFDEVNHKNSCVNYGLWEYEINNFL
jgi:retron-type reverse transcriptase